MIKRKTTKELLVESFMELSASRDVSKITIQEIAHNCGLSPATFYRHFSDKYDLIAWEYTRNFDERFRGIDDKSYTWADYTLETVQYSWRNRNYLLNLLNNTKGYQSYFRYVTEQTFKNYLDYLSQKVGKEALTEDVKLYLRFSVYGSVQLVCSWVMGEFEATPEHLTDILCNCVIDPLKSLT